MPQADVGATPINRMVGNPWQADGESKPRSGFSTAATSPLILKQESADSCFRMRGDVAAVENPERGLDSPSACHGLPTIRLIGVAPTSA